MTYRPAGERPPVEHREALERRVVVDAAEPKHDGVLGLRGRRGDLLSDERRPRPLVELPVVVVNRHL